jgi:hemin uptake protein HemP
MNDENEDVSQENKTGYGEFTPRDPVQVVRFEDLAHGRKEVVVEYENQHYRLRVTKNGKLILNK